jgi:hypothetical protein
VRTYATRRDYGPWPSAQIFHLNPPDQQVTTLSLSRSRPSDKSQGRAAATLAMSPTKPAPKEDSMFT